ncbi:MAG: class I SAM-dependent methyltransferase [bacterium]|nr:MAG: class I SAM-dependent methyltransferase [bacterium]
MAEKHFFEQQEYTRSYLIPYFHKHMPSFENFNVLEIGCGEAGLMNVFNEMGIRTVGVELEPSRVEIARQKNPHLNIQVGDITDPKIVNSLGSEFDLIIMRDVIEHVPDRETALAHLYQLLRESGYLYVTFPPRFSGFAGHQQNGKTLLRYIPYLHLLPKFLIASLGRLFHENPAVIRAVTENYQIGLSIRAFKKYLKQYKFAVIQWDLYLSRPIYQIRFQAPVVKFPSVPLLQEFLAFGCECLLQKG